MPLFAGRKVLYSLDRGDVKSALLRPEQVLRYLCGGKYLLLSLAKCIFAALKSFFD